MKELIASGLYGGGLVSVATPELIRRYNACLEAIDQEPSALQSFNIDAVGWSPEIASEKNNMDYLSLGAANRFAIILTPEQSGLPVYRPVHTFDRIAMEKVFRNAKAQIAALTGESALWLDFSHELTRFASTYDLLTVEWVNIRANDILGLINATSRQRELVSAFMGSDSAWADPTARAEIIDSAATFGDLRFRPSVIPEIKFTDLRSYHTRAFGGVYVFRDFVKSGQVLIMENSCPTSCEASVPTYEIGDEELPAFLEKQGIVDIPLGWYKQRAGIEYLEELLECLLADAFYAVGDTRNLADLNDSKRRSWVTIHENKINNVYFELERLILDLRMGTSVKELAPSRELRVLLFRPSKAAQEDEVVERVVWHLIARLASQDIERLFVCNRLHFYDLYQAWPRAKQEWVVRYLVGKGHPKLTHKGSK